ncbi:MAG TPA: pyridoxamine 5'-phosphate oxidase family protein [Candidatus Binatia bacterium]|nr:pyridoxamine 5'-phosphate oxidase family protein [Candidatus Binatia bacterium]
MSRSIGHDLTPALVALLSQRDLAALLGQAIPVVTVDGRGQPHPMLASYLELRATGPRSIRVVVGASSRTAENLEARGAATLLLVDASRTVYVKCRATGAGGRWGPLVRFDLAVEDVLEDTPAAWEAGLRITGGIAYAPPPALDSPPARAVLDLLDLD